MKIVAPVKPPRTKGPRDTEALERLVSSRPPCRVHVLSEPETVLLRDTLALPPAAFTEEQAWLLARVFEPGVPLTPDVIGSLYDALGVRANERVIAMVAERLIPNPVPPRAGLLRGIVRNAGRTAPWTVDTVLQLFRARRVTTTLTNLMDVLEWLQIEAADVDPATMERILATIKGRYVSFADLTELIERLGLELNLAQHIEVAIVAKRRRTHANTSRPLNGSDLDRIELALGLTIPTSQGVLEAAHALGLDPSIKSVRAAARILRQRRPAAKPTNLNTKARVLLELMADRTGLEKSLVIDHALMTVAKMMVQAGSAKFGPDLRQHVVRETIMAQFRLIPPEAPPPNPPVRPEQAKTRNGIVRNGAAAGVDDRPLKA